MIWYKPFGLRSKQTNKQTNHSLVLSNHHTVREIKEGRGRVLNIKDGHHKVSIVNALIAKSILSKSKQFCMGIDYIT